MGNARNIAFWVVLFLLILALFNLLPVYPLDGSRVVDGLISYRLRPAWERFARYSPLVLILIIIAPVVLGFSFIEWPHRLVPLEQQQQFFKVVDREALTEEIAKLFVSDRLRTG